MPRNVLVAISASEYSHVVFNEEFTTCMFADKGLEGAQDVRSVHSNICIRYYPQSVETCSHSQI